MVVTSCCPESWATLKNGLNAIESSVEIRLALCRQYCLALAVKEGVRPSRVRAEESAIRHHVHECFFPLDIEIRHTVGSTKCDICKAIETIRRMARSEFARECTAFMMQTQRDIQARQEYDLAAAVEQFLMRAGSGVSAWLKQEYGQVAAIIRKVQEATFEPCRMHEAEWSSVTGVDASGLDDLLAHSERKLASMYGQHLRVVR